MKPKIAYLEISPRMSGKTARLIGFANQLKSEGRTVIFVTPMAKAMPFPPQMPGVIVLSDGQAPPRGTDLSDAVWIYDEFDFLKSTKLRDGAYYATTAKRFRELGVDSPENDLLLELIEANGNRFERHFLFFGLRPDSWFTDGRAFHTDEQFRLSFIGEFLK